MDFERSATEAFDWREYVIGGFCPSKRLRVSVLPIDESLDIRDQRIDGSISTAFELFVCKQQEKSFDLVEP